LKNLKTILVLILAAIFIVILYIQLGTFGVASMRLVDANAYLTMNSRGFKLLVTNDGSVDIELNHIIINGSRVFTWNSDKTVLKPGENVVVNVFFYWLKGVKYIITVTGRGGKYDMNSSLVISTPVFSNKYMLRK